MDPTKGEMELRIIQNFGSIQLGGASKIGILGTQVLSKSHQEMIELLSYALVLSGNHVFTSAGSEQGTNVGVIKGALRANNPELLTVILPQSLSMQEEAVQELVNRVADVVEQSKFDDLELKDAANLCNAKIMSLVSKVLVFATHDSTTILEPLEDLNENVEVVKFFLD